MASRVERPLSIAVAAAFVTVAPVAVGPVAGQDRGVSYTLYGTPGLIEMPSAMGAPDGEFAGTLGYLENQLRTTFTFQITPRLTGSFRVTAIDDFSPDVDGRFYDRTFDLRYRLIDEGAWYPAVAIGLQDFIGAGVFSGEYIVASKAVSNAVRVTGGLGWGKLGGQNGFSNPLGLFGDSFETRPPVAEDEAGTLGIDQFFRGDAAFFGGVEWAINPQFTAKIEYSSDAYETTGADTSPAFQDRGVAHESPLNFGLNYRPRPGYHLQLAYLHGSTLALSGTVTLNPNNRPFAGGFDPAPVPVAVRTAADLTADARAQLPQETLRQRLRDALAAEGMRLEAVEIGERQARVRYTNTRYRAEAQAMGRAARAMTQILPASVEVFVLEPMQRGIALSAVTLQRSDIEALENEVGATEDSFARAGFADAQDGAGLVAVDDLRNPFSWGLSPYGRFTLFDEDEPLQIDVGLQLTARYAFQPNLILSGAIRKRLAGDDGTATPRDPDLSDLPVVRRDAGVYAREGDPGLDNLTLAHFGRPGADLYSRVSIGYLERMFGGISTEVLWKPVNSRVALGAEINYVKQRDFDLRLGFQDYEVATGHASVYYDFQNGFHGRVDAGRYLAGDWGATFALDREFENGWRVGGYVTLTDVPFDEFGEGAFDKGVRITIPNDFIFGRPSRRTTDLSLAAASRDAGARLSVDGRLYDAVRGGHGGDLADGWGRFWR